MTSPGANYSAGRAILEVVPSFEGVQKAIERHVQEMNGKLGEQGKKAGEEYGKNFQQAAQRAVGGVLDTTANRQQSQNAGRSAGDSYAGAFERQVQGRIAAALAATPRIKVDADTSSGERRIANLRTQLTALSDKKIGVDIDPSAALRELATIRRELAVLANDKTVNVQVRTDAATAAAELAQIRELAELVGRTNPKIDVKVDYNQGAFDRLLQRMGLLDHNGESAANSFRAFNAVILAGAAVLPAVVPALGAIAGGLALLGPLAVGAVAGLGTLAIGFGGVGEAVKAFGKVQDSASKDSQAAAERIATASRAVEDAQRSLGRAEENAARQGAAAQQAVSDARENAGRVAEQAAENVARALEAQEDAERDLEQAQVGVQRAQENLTRAREDAAEQIEDLRLQVEGGAIAERQAVLDLAEAERDLAAARAAGKVGDEIAQYILDVDKAELALRRAQEANGDLTAETQRWAETGIEGSRGVQDAQEGVRAANERVADAQERVGDAVAAVATAVRDGERAQAEASRAIQDAIAAQRQTQEDSARAISDAQANLTRAQQDYTKAVSETSTSMEALQTAMANLSPAAREFAAYWASTIPFFREFRDLVAQGMFPGLQEAIEDILTNNGPLLREFMFDMGTTLGNLFRQFGDMMTSPQWMGIWETFNQYAPAFMQQFGDMAMAMLTFFGELFRNLAPYALQFGEALVGLTRDWSNWAAGLSENNGFVEFMDWLFLNGPAIWADLLAIGGALRDILVALAPFGMLVLDALAGIAEFISSMDPAVLTVVASSIIGIVVAFQLAVGAVALFTQTESIWGKALSRMVFMGGLMVAGLVALYAASDDFRRIIDTVIGVIGDLIGVIGEILDWLGVDSLLGVLAENAEMIGMIALGLVALKVGPAIIAALSGVFQTAALYAMYAAGAVGSATTSMAGFRAALAGIMGLLGPVGWAVLGLSAAFGAVVKWSGDADEATKKWAEGLAAGGQAARDVQEEIDNPSLWERFKYGLMEGAFATDYSTQKMNEARAEAGRYYYSLSELDRAKASQAYWTNELAFRLDDENASARDVAIAQERLGYWTGVAEQEQIQLDQAVTGVNQALLDQQDRALALAEAEIAFAQSTDQLAQAHQRAADALNTNGAGSREYQDALSALESQQLNTAHAAGRLAESRYADSDAATKASAPNAAILANLIAQEQEYGKLPPRLQELKDSLIGTVEPGYLAQAQMDRLREAVIGVPNGKTITIDDAGTTDVEIEGLRDLGFEIVQLPNGDFEITATTTQAEDALNGLSGKWDDLRTRIGETLAGMFSDQQTGWNNIATASTAGASAANFGASTAFLAMRQSVGTTIAGILGDATLGFDQTRDNVTARANAAQLNAGQAWDGMAGQMGNTMAGNVATQAGHWAQIEADALARSGGTRDGVTVTWDNMRAVTGATIAGILGDQTAGFDQTLAMALSRSAGTRDGTDTAWQEMRARLGATVGGLLGDQTLGFDQTRAVVTDRTNTTRDNADRAYVDLRTRTGNTVMALLGEQTMRFDQLRGNITDQAGRAVGSMIGSFNTMPAGVAAPVNSLISGVINAGLITSFNNIVTELGLNGNLAISPAGQAGAALSGIFNFTPTRLAAGGTVPGWSPNDVADNIPAMLTAGEFVQPRHVVRHYGVDFMERLRKKKIPRDELRYEGSLTDRRPMRERYATGGLVGLPLDAFAGGAVRRAYGGVMAHVAAAGDEIVRLFGSMPGGIGGKAPRANVSDHPLGLALDFMTLGNLGLGDRLEQHIYANAARLSMKYNIWKQRIRYPGGGWSAMADRGSITANHFDHVHTSFMAIPGQVGTDPGTGSGIQVMLPAWYTKYGSPEGVKKSLLGSIGPGNTKLGQDFGTGPFIQTLWGDSEKSAENTWSAIEGDVRRLFTTAAASAAASAVGAITTLLPATGQAGSNQDIAKRVLAGRGWNTGAEWTAFATLVQKESSWNHLAQNPTSTAFGLMQFLNSTWAGTGISKTSDPALQIEAGARYIQARYGLPSKALAFHLANNWYSEGGQVEEGGAKASSGKESAPTLYDTGGWLPPGITTVLNATNKPEPVLTNDAWQELVSSRQVDYDGHRGPIRDLHLHEVQADLSQAVGTVNHTLRVLDKGGRYR